MGEGQAGSRGALAGGKDERRAREAGRGSGMGKDYRSKVGRGDVPIGIEAFLRQYRAICGRGEFHTHPREASQDPDVSSAEPFPTGPLGRS